MSKSKTISPRKRHALELLLHRLGHISTRSLMSGYAVNDWQDIELRKDTYPFCALYQISSILETC